MNGLTILGIAGSEVIIATENGFELKRPTAVSKNPGLGIQAMGVVFFPAKGEVTITSCAPSKKTGFWVAFKFEYESSQREFSEAVTSHLALVAPPIHN